MRALIIGGGGYVGSELSKALLDLGHEVVVYDLFIYPTGLITTIENFPRLTCVPGDIRDETKLAKAARNCDVAIHLACISNDPSCELDPALSKAVNLDSFYDTLKICRDAGVVQFIFASSASVYGISSLPEVTEDTLRVPVSDYNRYKAACEDILTNFDAGEMSWTVVRPGTICGLSSRQRFDLAVNMLTAQAMLKGKITVFGGVQQRPNLHIKDMVDLYLELIRKASVDVINRKTYNAGAGNLAINTIAELARISADGRFTMSLPVLIEVQPSNDQRSYRINSDRIKNDIGWIPTRSVHTAIEELCDAFDRGEFREALTSPIYSNVAMMKRIGLT